MSGLHSRPVVPVVPPDLAAAYGRAQAKLRQSAGAHYCDQYHPLMQVMEQARRYGGQHAADALAACTAVAEADEAVIAKMVLAMRPSPAVPSLAEQAAVRGAAMMQSHQMATSVAALVSRPRVSLAEQLGIMEGRGIRISVQGRHLKVHAPDGVLTEADRALLREHKAEIIGWLDTNAETI